MLLLAACDPSPPPPAAPQGEASPARATPETAEARRERLFREADLRAGVDPDQGLKPWRRGPGLGGDQGAKAAAQPAPCLAGQTGALRIEAVDAAPLYLSVDDAFAGPARVDLQTGRHAGEPALSLARLMPGVVALSSCKGQRQALDPALLAEPDRLLLVRNQRGQVKLIDARDDQGGRAPLQRDVTVLHGR